MRMLPFFKPKKGFQFAGSGGGGNEGSIDTSALVNKTDLTAIILTGTTNTSGNVISAGTWFYLNGTPCIAKANIASGATFTEGTNYEKKTVGSALSELNSKLPTSISSGVAWVANKTLWENIVDAFGNLKPGTTFALDGWNDVKASDSPFDNGWIVVNGILIGYQSDNLGYAQGYMIVRGTAGGVYKIYMCDMVGVQGKIWIALS